MSNLSLSSATQITAKWQEHGAYLAAEHEGDSDLQASRHGRPGPFPSTTHCVGAKAEGSNCLCSQSQSLYFQQDQSCPDQPSAGICPPSLLGLDLLGHICAIGDLRVSEERL